MRLAAQGLRAGHPDHPDVLHGVDVELAAGRRITLLGANGSGKTTLLRCLSGALHPRRGQVLRDAVPLRHTRDGLRAHRQAVQLVLQDPDDQLFAASAWQDVSFGPLNLGLPASEVTARVDEALALVSAEHLAERPVHRMSYGERKRIAVAGALAMRPAVLLLDEPTAGLDPAAVAELVAALAGLERRGTTVVLATHDVDLALRWADDVVALSDGRAVRGEAVDLLADAELLSRCRLRPPELLVLADGLRERGLLPADARPRDVPALLAALGPAGPAGSAVPAAPAQPTSAAAHPMSAPATGEDPTVTRATRQVSR